MPLLQVRRSSSIDQTKVKELIGTSYYRFCTHGDSWFSLGSKSLLTGNLLTEMEFSKDAVAIDSAKWGNELAQMVVWRQQRFFTRMLKAPNQWKWDAILLSCGGNDLIAAAAVRARKADGSLINLDQRILRRKDEWGDVAMGPSRFLSEQGWLTFENYFKTNLGEILSLRDSGESINRPVFFHGYGFATPRPAPVKVFGVESGPWLFPSMVDYKIPEEDMIPLARELIARFNKMGNAIASDAGRFPNVHFLDTTGINLVPARLKERGKDGDWDNEIHLTKGGLRKVADEYVALVEKVLQVQGRTHL